MYCEHFGLRQYPFALTPDTSNFYQGGNRGPILNSLLYAIDRGDGLIKVVGEVGSGKTMLCRMVESILPASADSVYLDNPTLGPEDLLSAIFYELGLSHDGPVHRLFMINHIKHELIKRHQLGRRVVLLVEEAQNMSLESLEELRLLSNLETSQSKLLQIVLFGQPELDEKLLHYGIRQLRDRIVHSFYLTPLDYDEVNRYILHRLRRAGYRGPNNFSTPAIKSIARSSQGLLRRINVIADKVMLAAYAGNAHLITGRHVKAAVRDSEIATPSMAWYRLLAGALALGVIVAICGSYAAELNGFAQNMWRSADPAVREVAPLVSVEAQDYLSRRVQASGAWLSVIDDSQYSIQILTAERGSEPALEAFLQHAAEAGVIDDLYIHVSEVGRYSVLYHSYTSYQEAVAALQVLPSVLTLYQPYPRMLRGVRRENR